MDPEDEVKGKAKGKGKGKARGEVRGKVKDEAEDEAEDKAEDEAGHQVYDNPYTVKHYNYRGIFTYEEVKKRLCGLGRMGRMGRLKDRHERFFCQVETPGSLLAQLPGSRHNLLPPLSLHFAMSTVGGRHPPCSLLSAVFGNQSEHLLEDVIGMREHFK